MGKKSKRARAKDTNVDEEQLSRTMLDFAMDMRKKCPLKIYSVKEELGTFKALCGCSVIIAMKLWFLLCTHMIPDPSIKINVHHFIWALFFMKHYPTEEVACATMGGLSSAIDPKTLRKYVRVVIYHLAALETVVVSTMYSIDRSVYYLFVLMLFFVSHVPHTDQFRGPPRR